MSSFHGWLGYLVVAGFFTLMVIGLALRIQGREEPPDWHRAVQYWTENLLAVTAVVGIVLLFLGRRVVGNLAWLHYFYGSLFPLIAIVAGRITGLRRKERGQREYIGWTWGAFFAFGLTLRALTMGLGIGV